MDSGYQARAALKAAAEGRWEWLIENKDNLAVLNRLLRAAAFNVIEV